MDPKAKRCHVITECVGQSICYWYIPCPSAFCPVAFPLLSRCINKDEAITKIDVFPPKPQGFRIAPKARFCENKNVKVKHRIFAAKEKGFELVTG